MQKLNQKPVKEKFGVFFNKFFVQFLSLKTVINANTMEFLNQYLLTMDSKSGNKYSRFMSTCIALLVPTFGYNRTSLFQIKWINISNLSQVFRLMILN